MWQASTLPNQLRNRRAQLGLQLGTCRHAFSLASCSTRSRLRVGDLLCPLSPAVSRLHRTYLPQRTLRIPTERKADKGRFKSICTRLELKTPYLPDRNPNPMFSSTNESVQVFVATDTHRKRQFRGTEATSGADQANTLKYGAASAHERRIGRATTAKKKGGGIIHANTLRPIRVHTWCSDPRIAAKKVPGKSLIPGDFRD